MTSRPTFAMPQPDHGIMRVRVVAAMQRLACEMPVCEPARRERGAATRTAAST